MPSATPSDLPSLHPSSAPSGTPSASPSFAHSDVPSVDPSSSPSVTGSEMPSATPSDLPTSPPTSLPSSSPTTLPETCDLLGNQGDSNEICSGFGAMCGLNDVGPTNVKCCNSNNHPCFSESEAQVCSGTCGATRCTAGVFICALTFPDETVPDCASLAQGDCTACPGGSVWTNTDLCDISFGGDPTAAYGVCESCALGEVCCNKGRDVYGDHEGFVCSTEALCITTYGINYTGGPAFPPTFAPFAR
eukprot:scaffold295395_cov55-Attheya_sp.AAC.1